MGIGRQTGLVPKHSHRAHLIPASSQVVQAGLNRGREFIVRRMAVGHECLIHHCRPTLEKRSICSLTPPSFTFCCTDCIRIKQIDLRVPWCSLTIRKAETSFRMQYPASRSDSNSSPPTAKLSKLPCAVRAITLRY